MISALCVRTRSIAAAAVLTVAALVSTPSVATEAHPTPDGLESSAGRAGTSGTNEAKARESLVRLKTGNDRYAKNALVQPSMSPVTRQALSKGQTPFAMILSCADSRVPPEYIFNTGLGELFVIRAAGEVVDRSILASLEYGAEHLHIPLLAVMGHESCGAVKAAVDNAPLEGPNLRYLVSAIRAGTNRTRSEQTELRTSILQNVEQVINDALASSAILRDAVDGGGLQVVGAYYELSSGRVMFSEPASTTPTVAAAKY